MKKYIVVAAMAVVLAAFQNCQQMNTGAGDADASSKVSGGQLTEVVQNDPEDNATGNINQPSEEESEAPRPGNAGGTPGNSGNNNGKNAGGLFVCILDGPGKSVKLGQVIGAAPAGQNPVPAVLCMSENACLNIASQVFTVKGPEFRGYCKLKNGQPHNPHVNAITDAALQKLIDELKKK